MTQVNGKRNYKHAYKLQKKTGETGDQLERQKARQLYDKKGINRAGKDIDHLISTRHVAVPQWAGSCDHRP
jgi:hypothetical protein